MNISRMILRCQRSLVQTSLTGAMLCAVGCQTFRYGESEGKGPLAATPISAETSIDGVKGPLEKQLLANRSQSIVDLAAHQNTPDFQEYLAARQLYDAGKYAEAEKAFKELADRLELDENGQYRKRRFSNWYKPLSERAASYTDGPIREDAVFMVAECRYQQKEYPGAQDMYLGLLKVYPHTRHLETSTQRLYDIARIWMQFKPTTNKDVELAAYEDTGRASKPKVVVDPDYDRPSFFNLTDRKRPFTDTEGRALECLKAIWLNDPTGPLADDALMLTASHYLRTGRNFEAAETYRLLREEFPDSPHVKDAYLLGAYVTQASYQGAHYDGKELSEARQLRLIALNSLGNLDADERKRLETELQQVDDATVARDFAGALYWLNRGRFEAVEMHCHHIINTYPSSKYAGKARGLLSLLPQYKDQNTLLLAMQHITADDIPSIDNMPSQTAEAPSMPQQRQQPQTRPAPAAPEPPEEESKPRYFPSWGIPKLKPIPIPGFQNDEPAPPEPEDAPPFNPSPGEKTPGRATLTLGEEPQK